MYLAVRRYGTANPVAAFGEFMMTKKNIAAFAFMMLPAAAWAQTAPVPEPEGLLLIVIGASAFFLNMMRKKR